MFNQPDQTKVVTCACPNGYCLELADNKPDPAVDSHSTHCQYTCPGWLPLQIRLFGTKNCNSFCCPKASCSEPIMPSFNLLFATYSYTSYWRIGEFLTNSDHRSSYLPKFVVYLKNLSGQNYDFRERRVGVCFYLKPFKILV